jgi:hypothetical protein
MRGAKILLFTPHPPLRVTLSLRERDSFLLHPSFDLIELRSVDGVIRSCGENELYVLLG